MNSPIDYEALRIASMAKNDSYIINSLLRCGLDFPTIFSLIWGDTLATNENFPHKLNEIVKELIREEGKKEEIFDRFDRQLHSIIIDLLWLFYEQEVNNVWEEAMRSSIK